MKQLSFEFVLVPLAKVAEKIKTRVTGATLAGIELSINLGGKLVSAIVPDWVVCRGDNFIRGWIKAGGKA